MKRNSMVREMSIYSVQGSSIVEIGDTVFTNSVNRTISIKREQELFYSAETTFETLPIFQVPIPVPENKLTPPIIRKYHKIPTINVKHINIMGVSNSGVVQVGSTKNANLESRVFHSRQLLGAAERTR